MTSQIDVGGAVARDVTNIGKVRHTRAIGQVDTAATTATTLYTVPVKRLCRGRVYVAERAGAAATYRIAIREDGDALANEHYVAYDAPLPANDYDYSVELLLDETDVITVYASTGDLSFSFLGELEPKDTT